MQGFDHIGSRFAETFGVNDIILSFNDFHDEIRHNPVSIYWHSDTKEDGAVCCQMSGSPQSVFGLNVCVLF